MVGVALDSTTYGPPRRAGAAAATSATGGPSSTRCGTTSIAKVLVPTAFSPLTELDLAAVPAPGDEVRGPQLPALHGGHGLAAPRAAGHATSSGPGPSTCRPSARAAEHGVDILELVAVFTPLFGAGPQREVVLWQRVEPARAAPAAARREVPAEHRGPGTWMHDALEVRDRWESRLLRVAPWSPLA